MTQLRQAMFAVAIYLAAVSPVARLSADEPTLVTFPRNLARTATITASTEHEHLPATAVADGRISEAGAGMGEAGSWAVLGDKEKGTGEITFAWPESEQVGEVVYIGRCAWQLEEVFKGYEVFGENRTTPLASGELEKRGGPQRISFNPVRTKTLTLRFLTSHGGSNPGANEILIFAEPIAIEQLQRAVHFVPNSIFSDHMVLQQHRPLRIFGTAIGDEKVAVEFRGHRAEAVTTGGKWEVLLPEQSPGDPAELRIRSGAGEIVVRDVLVGEVWIASGQSNMEMPVDVSYWPSRYDGVADAKQEVAAGDYPEIRMFYVPRVASGLLREDTGGQWRVCSPKTVGGFSAVPYFFGRKLNKDLKVPIGLVDCSWGATYIESWTSLEGLNDVQQLWKTSLKATDEQNAALKASIENPKTHPTTHQHQPTSLFNGMVHRLTRFPIRGAIWYQGEGNVGDGMLYFQKMKALIGGWRKAWKQGDFPFLYVQLTPYDYGMYKGSKDPYKLPALWEAQTAALALPNTGMVVTTDISDVKNIHPPNKQEVGLRLANWALATTYKKSDIAYQSPEFLELQVEPGQLRLVFQHCESGLKSRDDKPLSWFTIAGPDQVFHPAEATIDGDSVVVRSVEVKEPIHVRFAWHKLAEPNLCNSAGLPAIPFRTDTWTVQTGLDN